MYPTLCEMVERPCLAGASEVNVHGHDAGPFVAGRSPERAARLVRTGTCLFWARA